MTRRPQDKSPVPPPAGAALLTVREAAFVLRASADTVYRLIAGGELAVTTVRAKRLIARGALEAYIRAQTTTRAPGAVGAAPLAASVGLKESGLWDGEDD